MPARTLVLASGSTARLRLLRAAGFDPEVVVSGVDEDDLDPDDTRGSVVRIAEAKAAAVATPDGTSLVIGCDSMLEFEGRPHGKPASLGRGQVVARVDARAAPASCTPATVSSTRSPGVRAAAVASTTVHFATTTPDELDAYLATPEVLAVAGAFTLDGRSAPFVEGIEGDPSNVIGLSLPLLRELLGRFGLSVTDLWVETAP